MIVISMVLVVAGFVALLLGVVGVGDEPLQFVYASIGACLVAAVLLVAGVLRARPSRRPTVVADPATPTWSGAVPPRAAPATGAAPLPGDTHVQVLSAHDAAQEAVAATGTAPLELDPDGTAPDADAEHERFVRTLQGLDLGPARLERLRGRFVTLERLQAASVAELAEVPGVGTTLARAIHDRLRARG